jgi:hypothetical protein
VCAAFGVHSKKYLQFHTKHSDQTTHSKTQSSASINQRILKQATLFIADSHARMKAVRAACDIEQSLKTNQEYMAKKPSKMDLVILFYVCTEHLQLKIKKGEYIAETSISSTTFNRHLKLLKCLITGHQ